MNSRSSIPLFTDSPLSRVLPCPFSSFVRRIALRNCSVNTELIYRMNASEQELGVRIEVYGVPAILFFRIPRLLEYCVTVEMFHHLSGCGVPFSFRCVRKSSTPLLFLSPGPRNVQCPSENLFVYSLTFSEFEIQIQPFPFIVQSMSFDIDMQMIQSVNFLGSMFRFRKSFWIS